MATKKNVTENVKTMVEKPREIEVTELKEVLIYKLNNNIKCNGMTYPKGYEFNGFHQNFDIFKDFIN
jgi:hypothetical protein